MLKYIKNSFYKIVDDSVSTGVPYSDCFFTRTTYCLTKVENNSCKLLVYAKIVYLEKPMFLIKSNHLKNYVIFYLKKKLFVIYFLISKKDLIEKNWLIAIQDYYTELSAVYLFSNYL
jgi:hypothetical protein